MKVAAYLVSSLIGFAIGHFLLGGAAAAYASLLISYHLFLIFLVASTEQEKGLSLPIFQTLFTHAAVLALLVGLAYTRSHIPLFGLLTWIIPSLAPFEAKWLFGGQDGATRKAEAPSSVEVPEATAEDNEEFLLYLRQEYRPFRKPGIAVEEEYKAWLADRAKKRAEAEALAVPNVAAGSGAISQQELHAPNA